MVSTSMTIPAGHLNAPFAVVTPEEGSKSNEEGGSEKILENVYEGLISYKYALLAVIDYFVIRIC